MINFSVGEVLVVIVTVLLTVGLPLLILVLLLGIYRRLRNIDEKLKERGD